MPRYTDRHQNKKAYQPQITSFFTSSANALSEDSSQPSLAPSIQSSLLSVGMRIRKAVPEGYKTHKTLPLGAISATKLNRSQSYSNDVMADSTPILRPRELTPFCGIHRVGGMSVQETMIDSVNGYDAVDAYGENSGLFTSSQESNLSITGEDSFDGKRLDQRMAPNTHKRQFDEESDDEDIPNFGLDPDAQLKRFPGRYFAKPRSRRRESGAPQAFTTFVDMDFDEASFLKPSDFEMGGV